ncbi:MAG: YeeE/YedE thiosulfate transporter family protein [Anaerolineales bacterium]
MTVAAVASLIVGLSIGFLGQRSRMCFVGGIRDFILVRDTFLLKGLVAFGLVAWLAFPLAGWIGGATTAGSASPDLIAVLLTALGGFGVGYLSILANGCPFRQHVLAAQGTVSSMTYLAGFFVGAIIFHALVAPLLVLILP